MWEYVVRTEYQMYDQLTLILSLGYLDVDREQRPGPLIFPFPVQRILNSSSRPGPPGFPSRPKQTTTANMLLVLNKYYFNNKSQGITGKVKFF